MTRSPYTRNTPIEGVMDDPVFGGFGRLILPDHGAAHSGHSGQWNRRDD